MGMAAPTYWTAEMVRQLPDDGNRYEVVYGELLVTPAPRFDHQLLVSRLAVAIAIYLDLEPVGNHADVARRHLLGAGRAGSARRLRCHP